MELFDRALAGPAANLACDEALLDAVEAGEQSEVLRFWESPEHFVVVGYGNNIATEVNVAACAARGIPILRRCSGGGTVVQGPGCLNYALVLRITEHGPTRTIIAANQFIMERHRAAIESQFRHQRGGVRIQGHTDLTLEGRKFSGNSQRRRKHFLLFHGTMLLHFDLALVSELLPVPTLQPAYRRARAHGEFVTNLGMDRQQVIGAIKTAWQPGSSATAFPERRIGALVAEKYNNREWIRRE